MYRYLLLTFFLVVAGWGRPLLAAPAADLPPRPTPFRFVTDQAHLLSEADANTLEKGLRRYADETGTQIVVVTVPTLGGRDVADYGRALGEAWGVGQRDKNNGLVVLLAGQEHKLTIQAGEGLRSQITPALTNRVINQDMTPSFKQGRYFMGLRKGLNTLMYAANPSSAPAATTPQAASSAAAAGAGSATSPPDLTTTETPTTESASEPFTPYSTTAPEPAPSGPGMGTLLIGALVVGGVIWLLVRLFRRRSAPASTSANTTPDFLPNRPGAGGYSRGSGNQQAPDFLPNRSGGGSSGGSGIGGMLATGAAAAAGAYLGNRMASAHDTPAAPYTGPVNQPNNLEPPAPNAYDGTPSGEFPALGGTYADDNSAPDYFSDNDSGPDYFSSDDSSYDDPSSGDSGGGGFDDTNDNSGSW